MITTQALIHGDYQRLLAFDSFEHPIALQLGGNDPTQLAQCAKLGERLGYDEININIGCPSNRVKSGQFGACLMLNPVLVADCVFAMCQAVTIPITVKCRIGVDHHDSYEELHQFIKKVASAGCKIFIIHARKAWLTGLSPKQNRHIPPLRYDIVRKIKQDFPQLIIIINGGINTLTDIKNHLQFVDGVMIGREAYSNPYFLAEIEKQYFGSDMSTRHAIIEKFIPYIEKQLADKVKLTMITRHILGLFQGQAGARNWRRYISENAHKAGADTKILKEALHYV
jgi:tRNA-dihydrouridine synthase A